MDKRRAIQIMTKAAQLYKEHLEDQKVLFLYGVPSEIKSYSQDKYTCIEKLDKDIDLSSYRFSEEIENIIDRDSIYKHQ